MNYKQFKLIFSFIIYFVDLILVYLSYILAYNSRFYYPFVINIFPITKGIPSWQPYQQLLYLVVFTYGFIFLLFKFYQYRVTYFIDELLLVAKGTVISSIILIVITFIHREYEYSRLVLGFGALISTVLVFIWHEVNKYIYRWFVITIAGPHNVIIIGEPKQIEQFKKTIHKFRYMNTYFIMDKRDEDSLLDIIKKRNIKEVFITATYFDLYKLLSFSYKCEQLNVDFKVIPTVLQLLQGQVLIDESLPIPVFHIKPLSLYGINFYIKRTFDIIISIILCSVLFFPMLVIACLIVIDSPGPVFYKHDRVGFKGRHFKFYKFRSMVKNAEEILEKIKQFSEREGPVFKMKNDPRVTRIGKILRRFSIDEFPQILNVLKGDMSLVGPRPQVVWEAEAYDDIAKRRLRVLPGITGLWQISGRADIGYDEMIELDLYYIENWTLGLDIWIILKTIPVIFSKKGAY